MNRRLMISNGAIFLGLGANMIARRTSAAPPAPPVTSTRPAPIGTQIANPGAGPLSAILDYQGTSYRYDELSGVDQGDYIDPRNRFVQACIRVTHDRLPLTVYFRRDKGASRAEVVFELGRLWSKTPPANMDAYRVTILQGDKIVFATDVPQHFWSSRWRWQSAPRPVTVRVSDLIANGLLPHYDNNVNRGSAHPLRQQSYEIMGLAGIIRSMGSTGERPDIGPVTEAQGEFICTGNKGALETLLAQGESAGTWPWHYRDENTGAPIDLIRYTNASAYSPDTGNPYLARTNSGLHPDTPHQPALAYLPFLLTGDPYFLEELQYQVTYNFVESPPNYRFRMQQIRGNAWSMRTLGQAAMVTPDATPRWLQPRRYFRDLLNAQHDWIKSTFVDSTDTVRTVFRTTEQTFLSRQDGPFEPHTVVAPWQEEFQAFIFGWLVQMGHADWEPIFRWKIGSTIARTDGRSGWIRAYCTPNHQLVREHPDSPWGRSWGESWAMNQSRLNLQYDDPNRLPLDKPGKITYPTYTRGALAMAVRLGVTDAKPCFDWIDGQISSRLGGPYRLDYKWSVA